MIQKSQASSSQQNEPEHCASKTSAFRAEHAPNLSDDAVKDDQSPAGLARPPRHLGKKLILAFFSLVLCLLLLEIAVRLLYKPSEFAIAKKYFVEEPWPFTFRMNPNQTIFIRVPEMAGGGSSVELNGQGFRGDDHYEVTRHKLRIASVGDSFTFGWGLQDFRDQCVVGFVEDYKAAHSDADIGLSVVAGPGWGPTDYLVGYREFGSRVSPQLVLVGFFCGDDIVEPGALDWLKTTAPPKQRFDRPPPPFFRIATLDWAKAMVRGSPTLTKLALSLGFRPSGDLMRFLCNEPEAITARWGETLEVLKRLSKAVRADGAQMVMISYPSLIQVAAHKQLDDADFDYRRVDARLELFCKENGIAFIPFLPALLADKGSDLYYKSDRHLTPRGQQVCKKVLLEKLSPILEEIAAKKR